LSAPRDHGGGQNQDNLLKFSRAALLNKIVFLSGNVLSSRLLCSMLITSVDFHTRLKKSSIGDDICKEHCFYVHYGGYSMPEVIINGPAGRLEGRYQPASNRQAPIALVLHPHPNPDENPANRGTMNNKVVYVVYHALVQAGYSVLRFNFRGVGKSQGEYAKGEGELADAAAALDWMQQQNRDAPRTLIAGFSFGAWIGMQLLMRRPEIDNFISVAPPANKYDFSFLAPCPSSGLIITGDKDEIVTESSVRQLAQKISKQKDIRIDYTVVPGVDHFFSGQLDVLVRHVDAYLKKIA
jgi:alpha/beta superfamily hydrolase